MALTKTTDRMKAGSFFNVLDRIPQSEHAAIKDGTTTYNATSVIQSLINEIGLEQGTPAIYFPAGTYIVSNLTNVNGSLRYSLTLIGETKDSSILKAPDFTNPVLKIGQSGDSWGQGGEVYLEHLRISTLNGAWASHSGSEDKGLVELYSTQNNRIRNCRIDQSGNSGLFIFNLGYSSISECNIQASKFDNVFFKGTSSGFAATSSSIKDCQLNTGLQSCVHFDTAFGITVDNCQLEDGETGLLITGGSNGKNVISNCWFESTRGSYNIDVGGGSAAGCGNLQVNNCWLGATDGTNPSIRIPSPYVGSLENFIWFNNRGGAAQTPYINGSSGGDLGSPDWLVGSRTDNAQPATLVGAYAATSAQQTAVVEARTENDYGAGLKGTSVGGSMFVGLLRGSAFEGITANQNAYLSLKFNNSGGVNVDPDDTYALHIYGGTGAGLSRESLKCSHAGGTVFATGGLGTTMTGTPNAADAAIDVYHPNTTTRSINASGTVNASGTDYAEYMTKCGDFTISKGDICGINSNGLLTNVFADAITFVVKSTNPSYVGGDFWGDLEGKPQMPARQINEDGSSESDEEFLIRQSVYEKEKAEWDLIFEERRKMVDRIAFSGQVPVNIYGAVAGDFIIPIDNNGSISGQPVSNPTLDQYMSAIGKVIAIEDDGRARIIVKIS